MTTKLYSSSRPIRILFHQLWASLSKSEFYYDLIKFYRGYGIKYFLFQITICALLASIFIFDNLLSFKNYFDTGKVTAHTKTIDHIMEQLPRFYYNGNFIAENDESTSMPIYINDLQARKIAVFDFHNNLSQEEKNKIPLVFNSKKLLVNLVASKQKNHENVILDYPKIFGNEAKIIDKESIKTTINNYFKHSSIIFTLLLIVVSTFIYALFYSITILIKQFFIVVLVYISVNSLNSKMSFEQIVKKFTSEFDKFARITFFSSGSIALVQLLLIYLMPDKAFLINFLHLWLGYLIYQGFSRTN